MLHENEPGAWDFARELESRGVPLDAIPIARDFDPAAFMRLVSYVGRERPTILHTHLVHADAYGQIAGRARGRAGARVDEARLQRVPRGTRVRARRPRRGEPRARPHRHLARPRAVPRAGGGLRRRGLRDRPLRHRAARRAAAVRRVGAAAPLRRPADPDQGPHRAAARIRRGSARGARPDARHRGPRAARAGAEGARARARDRRTPCASSATCRRSRRRSSAPR